MTRIVSILNLALWLSLAVFPARAQQQDLDELFALLQTEGLSDYAAIEAKIGEEWSKSGSDAMDLLLSRGQDAIEAGELAAAVEHLTALTDHAPDFAEGWNALGTAYYLQNLYGPAMDALERTLVLNPRHFDALSGVGIILREVGNEDAALAAFRAAHALTPHREELNQAISELQRSVEGRAL